MIHYMLLLNVEVHFLTTLVKGMQISVNYIPHTLNIYGGNIDVSFVLSQAKEPLCVTRSSSRVLVFDRIDCSQSPIFS